MARDVRYSEFSQLVRRFRPSQLLPFLARQSASLESIHGSKPDLRREPPWAVAAMARESILHGTEFRQTAPDSKSLTRLYNLLSAAHFNDDGASLALLLTPMLHEQFLYQEGLFPELARIAALLDDPALGMPIPWQDIFGVTLPEAVRASFVLHTWVAMNSGQYDAALLNVDAMAEVFQKAVPRPHIELVARYLTSTIEEARREVAKIPPLPESLDRYGYNPLTSKPLIDLGEAGVWAPQTALVIRALFPANLYYAGLQKWGKTFADLLGDRTEKYVGNQLGLVAGVLYPEITYGKPEKKGVDWIWVTDQAVILVEVKSARLTLGARAGDGTLRAIVERYIGHARQQIDMTASLIRSGHPAFAHIPTDRKIVGVAVTAEPFYLANSRMPEYGVASATPSISMSLRDVEQWVELKERDAVEALLDVLADPEKRTWSFGRAVGNHPGRVTNKILEAAWERYAFLDARDGSST